MMRITTMAVFLSVCSYAQKNYSINGVVKDQDTGELISGAVIKIKEKPEISIETNEYGFYSLSLPENDYTLIISHDKHKDAAQNIHLDSTKKIDWTLKKDEYVIEEINLKDVKRSKAFSTQSKMGAEKLDIQGISKLPVLLGEKDIMKTLQFLPGVSSQEGSSGFSVRGGNLDQNLILLDEAPVFNNSHLAGFFSTFNSDALRSVTLYKGNIPSQYGGRLSSVVDVKMKEGNNQNFGVAGGIGLISSRISFEGPIQKGKSSFIVSARRTYLDLFLNSTGENGGNTKLYFYDLNAKFNYQINKNNSIHFSSYLGRDIMSFDKFKNNWGNLVGTLRWNSIINSNLFSNTSLTYSNYDYRTNIIGYTGNIVEINPNVRNWGFKQDFSNYVGTSHTFNYGLQASYYDFFTNKLPDYINSEFLKKERTMWESALYFNDDYKISEKLFMNYGVRLSMLNRGKDIEKDEETSKRYINFEPRLMLNYEFNKNNSIRAGYTRLTQNLQTLNNGGYGQFINNDIWLNLKKPLTMDQVNLAYTKKFNKGYEVTSEVFYKKMANLVDYKDGLAVDVLDNVENNLLYNGIGRAYGFELLAKKTKGRLTGWVSYTLSKTERKIDGINEGNWYNANSDKTHNLSVVASYELTPAITFSGAFVYSTGNAVTFPVGVYNIDGQTVFQYGARNSNRMPAYHRLDLNVTYEPKTTKRFKSSWSFGVYNIYGKQNPYTISFEKDMFTNTIRAKQETLLSIVPNVAYNFKF